MHCLHMHTIPTKCRPALCVPSWMASLARPSLPPIINNTGSDTSSLEVGGLASLLINHVIDYNSYQHNRKSPLRKVSCVQRHANPYYLVVERTAQTLKGSELFPR